jgi:hypothetical protein
MKYLVTTDSNRTATYSFEMDMDLNHFAGWAREHVERFDQLTNPIRESESIEIIDIDLQEVISKAEAYEILADDLSYKDDGTALGREQRLKYLEILKPQE